MIDWTSAFNAVRHVQPATVDFSRPGPLWRFLHVVEQLPGEYRFGRWLLELFNDQTWLVYNYRLSARKQKVGAN